MKTRVFDLSKTLRKYKNEWLALDPISLKVVATGSVPKVVLKDALENGTQNPVLTKAPTSYGTYIL